MRIRPYDETIDRSNLVDLMNQTNKHFDHENPFPMTIESLDLNLSTFDLTVLSRDFLVVKDNILTSIDILQNNHISENQTLNLFSVL